MWKRQCSGAGSCLERVGRHPLLFGRIRLKIPLFLDKRVYQGSNGKVYPNAFTERVSDQSVDVIYRGVFLENDHVRFMILPEIGGLIHIAQD